MTAILTRKHGNQDKFQQSFLPPANQVWRKVIFSVACVKNSVHRGGGSASVHSEIPPHGSRHPQEQTPNTADTQHSRHPLGADTPPWSRHPWEQSSPQEQAPLCSACWEIRSTSGRYASYWNTILLCNGFNTLVVVIMLINPINEWVKASMNYPI